MRNLKTKAQKAFTGIATLLVILVLFASQYLILTSSLDFFTTSEFWVDTAFSFGIIIAMTEIYWRNGSARALNDAAYTTAASEYSIAVSELKNSIPNRIQDFRDSIMEENMNLIEEARYEYLLKCGVSKEYFLKYNKFTKKELKHLTIDKVSLEGILHTSRLFSRKQIKAIINATKNKFDYEELNATELLSGIKYKNNKYAVSYSSKKNKTRFITSSISTAMAFAIMGAAIIPKLADSTTVAALFIFGYRVIIVIWRSINADDAGYSDIVDTKKGVYMNRTSLIATYMAKDRKLISSNSELPAKEVTYESTQQRQIFTEL